MLRTIDHVSHHVTWHVLCVFFLLLARSVRSQMFEKEGAPDIGCPTAAVDKTSPNPTCDPCSPFVYTEYKNTINTEIYTAYTTAARTGLLQGWTRFMVGKGRITEQCPLQYTCGATYPAWLNSAHPTKEQGITTAEICLHYTNGNCCTYKEEVQVKNCGNYVVYRLTAHKPLHYNYLWAYCIEPEKQPDVCGDSTFSLFKDTTSRGELSASASVGTEPIDIARDNKWYTFKAGKGTIKQSCPGLNNCGFRYPMWIDGDYPTKEGEIVNRMGHAATDPNKPCESTQSKPVYIVKCGKQFYHKFDRVTSYSGFCVDEEYSDLCKSAVPLQQDWRGTTVELPRDHCDTNGLTDFEDWYRIKVHQKKLPDECVAPNKCGADYGYYVHGGHPAVGDGIVGRNMYFATATNCKQGVLQGYILNCGDDKKNDYIYKFSKPSSCDKVFCAEEDPCSSDVYNVLDGAARAGRTPLPQGVAKVTDYYLDHGWYRFTAGKGIMSTGPIFPGHSGITYPGWYDGIMPDVEGQTEKGRACFVVGGNSCYVPKEVTVKKCKDFFVYHLQRTSNPYGYTYEEDVCGRETMDLDANWRLQYNLEDGVQALSDNTLKAGWYEVKIGNKRLATEPSLYKVGGVSRYPGWMEGDHPTEEEGIVERIVYFTTSDTQFKGSNIKIGVRNCGSRFIYYLRPWHTNYFYSVSQDLCKKGSYIEVNQDYRLYSNPSEKNLPQNSDNKFFKTFTRWYRFTNGNGKIAEQPKVNNYCHGGFLYPYQFPEGSHASVPAQTISKEITLGHYRGPSNPFYVHWPWKLRIANCGDYFVYRIPPLHPSYNRAGLVVDDDDDDVCSTERYTVTNDKARLISETATNTGTSDYTLAEGWYRLTAGLGYMPTVRFGGTQCSTTYHGHLKNPHPEEDTIQENLVEFIGTNPNSIVNRRKIWVKKCDGYYLYRLRESPSTSYRYCEVSEGCTNSRALSDDWRNIGIVRTQYKYESSHFGSDGWVHFTTGIKKLPTSPPPINMGGCTYNGYIDSHPTKEEGVVDRVLRFPGSSYTYPIQVQNCEDKMIYFLTRSISNNYCYAADTDACSNTVYKEVDDKRRLHYSHKYGSSIFTLDNTFKGWIRYTIGTGRMMEEPPQITGMCTAYYQGWLRGTHPEVNEGTVKREICWKVPGHTDCYYNNDISVRNCGDYVVYGITKTPSNAYYGHCVEQNKEDVCEGATKLDDDRRGMNSPNTNGYVNDQNIVKEDGYYRFMNGLGRLTSFPIKTAHCGGYFRMLIKSVRERDDNNGAFLFDLQLHYTSGWYSTIYRNLGLKCDVDTDSYWVYQLLHVNVNQMSYCVEEDICGKVDVKKITSTANLQWQSVKTGSTTHSLETGWYEATVGSNRLSHSPPDLNDCGAIYPGYVNSPPPEKDDGITPGKVCYRTNNNGAPTSSCQDVYMRKCDNKYLYYLTKSHNVHYAICVETDVCKEVEGTPLDDTWRLNGTPKLAAGYDKQTVGWYKVNIGDKRLAVTNEEANCGATYPGWMMLGRHPDKAEGAVNTQICYKTTAAKPANCRDAMVINCGTHYLYHLRPASAHYGLCIASSEDSMCSSYTELDEEWRSTEYSETIVNNDVNLPAGWYRLMSGLKRLSTHCPEYKHGGGHYPSWVPDHTVPAVEDGVQELNIYWKYTSNCKQWHKKGYIRNCGDFNVYYLPQQTVQYTTYTIEADACSNDLYEVINDDNRLAWSEVASNQVKSDIELKSGWYKFETGLNKINEECVPQNYGGASRPGWMDGGHDGIEVGQVVDRRVYFRYSTNCKIYNKMIKVKNCGDYFIYRLTPTPTYYGYTIASDPCDVQHKTLNEEDRSIFEKSKSYLNDNSLPEAWYEFKSGSGLMANTAPPAHSCRTPYPVWMEGQHPTKDEGTVTRKLCTVYNHVECQWHKEVKVRNCGNDKMLYYFNKPPHGSARFCVDDSLSSPCASAKSLDESWRGAAIEEGTVGKFDRAFAAGWYKFTQHGKRLANYPVGPKMCGSTYPIWMEGDHVMEKNTCKLQTLYQTNNYNNIKWRTGKIYECQCNNGDYIYYHEPRATPVSHYEGTYCVEQDPCKHHSTLPNEGTRSPWNRATAAQQKDNILHPKWIKIGRGTGKMPTFSPETYSCGTPYPAWYDGEMPTDIGQVVKGRYCFVTSTSAICSSPREARVMKCADDSYIYHVIYTAHPYYGYCVDEDVCETDATEWGEDQKWRLRYTSVLGHTSSYKSDNQLGNRKWYKLTIGLGKMPDECVPYKSCGTFYPGWLSGEHPTPEQGVVDREVCFSIPNNCCHTKKPLKIVSCVRDSKQFYLYRIDQSSGSYGYCIDEDDDEVCKIPDKDIQHVTDKRHGTGIYYDTSFPADYQLYKDSIGWTVIDIHEGHYIHSMANMYMCGTIYAGWIEGAAPGPKDGVTVSRVCYKRSNELCNDPTPISMKNCNGQMRYMYIPIRQSRRNICVEQDICKAGNYKTFADETWRKAYSYTGDKDYKKDYRKIAEAPYRGWIRFTGVGNNKLTTFPQEYQSCGTQFPAWMEGEHPSSDEGIVTRKLYVTHTGSNYKWVNQNIFVKNCGDFVLYNINFNWHNTNWALCMDTDVCQVPVNELSESHRLLNTWGLLKSSGDNRLKRGWYTFKNGKKKMPETCPIANSCGSTSPGYLSQPHPEETEGIVDRKVCFGDADQCCVYSTDVLVKNCGSHYRYRLWPTARSNEKYCVDESDDAMCKSTSYKELNEERRGENVPYDASNKFSDQLLDHGWYRFTSHLGRMPDYPLPYQNCGLYYPGYLSGGHPTKEDGITNRKVCYSTSATNSGNGCQNIRVKNCGDYFVYELVPSHNYNYGYCVAQDECDGALELEESHRLLSTWGKLKYSADNTMNRRWYKFTNGRGKMPEECPALDSCGARQPGYLSSTHPTVQEGTVKREVCFKTNDNTCCGAKKEIHVKNCGTHFVYRLEPTTGYQKYCVDENPDAMCDDSSYKELDEKRRGENVAYDATNKFNDRELEHGWYRFTSYLGRMPEYALPYQSCGMLYPGYLHNPSATGTTHPTREDGIVNRQVCYSTNNHNERQSCQNIRTKNCGGYYVYELIPTHNYNYGYCVAQDHCEEAKPLAGRWRLSILPNKVTHRDDLLKKGWYRMVEGNGVFPHLEPERNYGGALYGSYMPGELPSVDDGDVERTLKYATVGTTSIIRVKNCGKRVQKRTAYDGVDKDYYIFYLKPSPSYQYAYTTDANWCSYGFKQLSGYSSGTNIYPSLVVAQKECLKRTDCSGVTKEPVGAGEDEKYTLRKLPDLLPSDTEETSWKLCNSMTFESPSVEKSSLYKYVCNNLDTLVSKDDCFTTYNFDNNVYDLAVSTGSKGSCGVRLSPADGPSKLKDFYISAEFTNKNHEDPISAGFVFNRHVASNSFNYFMSKWSEFYTESSDYELGHTKGGSKTKQSGVSNSTYTSTKMKLELMVKDGKVGVWQNENRLDFLTKEVNYYRTGSYGLAMLTGVGSAMTVENLKVCYQPPPCEHKDGTVVQLGGSYMDEDDKECTCSDLGVLTCKCPDLQVSCPGGTTPWTHEETCESRCVRGVGSCHSVGDPHYRTFDGKYYDFHGECTYQAASCGDFQVYLKNFDSLNRQAPRYTGRILIMYNGFVFKIGKERSTGTSYSADRAWVNNNIVNVPYVKTWTNGDRLEIYNNGNLEMKLHNKGRSPSVRVMARSGSFYINAYIWLHGSCDTFTEGLCGSYNGNNGDDLAKPRDTYKLYDESCPAPPPPYDPCKEIPDGYSRAEAVCSALKKAPFASCNSQVNVGTKDGGLLRDCMIDWCDCELTKTDGATEQQVLGCMCSTLDGYAEQCIAAGVDVSKWRHSISYCPFECFGGTVYKADGVIPAATCLDRNPKKTGTGRGCFCPDGKVLQGDKCVSLSECKCSHEGVFYNNGAEIKNEGECKLCTCEDGGTMSCKKMMCPELGCKDDEIESKTTDKCCPFCNEHWVKALNPVNNLQEDQDVTLTCQIQANGVKRKNILWLKDGEEITTGISDDRLQLRITSAGADDIGTYTCKAKHKSGKWGEDTFEVNVFIPFRCIHGDGTVLEVGERLTDEDGKVCTCLEPKGLSCACPAQTTTCKAPTPVVWQDPASCDVKCFPNPAYCRSSGDPHYATFDGKYYDYHGKCTYVAATCDDFQVNFKNVDLNNRNAPPRYTFRLEIEYQGQVFAIEAGNKAKVDDVVVQIPYIKTYTNGDRLEIKMNGKLEMTLYSMGRTPYAAKLRSTNYNSWISGELWLHGSCAEHTEGLCGNWNFNAADDVPQNDVNAVGDQYKLYDEHCPAPPPPFHMCDLVPHGLEKATEICKVMTKAPFKQCNNAVPVGLPKEGLLGECVTDVCMCFLEERCACDPLESYASTCINNGIDLADWRNDITFCPFDCPEGQVYKSKGSVPSATCLDRQPESTGTARGCYCPNGKVLQDGKCVDVPQCKCLHEGNFYEKGEKIEKEGECESCECKTGGEMECGKKECRPLSCKENAIIANKPAMCCPYCDDKWVTARNPDNKIKSGQGIDLICQISAQGILKKNILWFRVDNEVETQIKKGVSRDRLKLKLKDVTVDSVFICRGKFDGKTLDARFTIDVMINCEHEDGTLFTDHKPYKPNKNTECICVEDGKYECSCLEGEEGCPEGQEPTFDDDCTKTCGPTEPTCDEIPGQVWNACACTKTCETPEPKCDEKTCEAKCQCPDDAPILHEGACISEDKCPPPLPLFKIELKDDNVVDCSKFSGKKLKNCLKNKSPLFTVSSTESKKKFTGKKTAKKFKIFEVDATGNPEKFNKKLSKIKYQKKTKKTFPFIWKLPNSKNLKKTTKKFIIRLTEGGEEYDSDIIEIKL